jgi:hypothetical protein
VGVKGGEKPDRRGGEKLDHFQWREGLIWFGSTGAAGAEACAAVFGGAFRPERKLPL